MQKKKVRGKSDKNATVKKFFGIFVGITLFSLLFPSYAFAYIDPGTGSYIIQILIATLLGLLFSIKLFWQRIKEFITKIFSLNKTQEDGAGRKEK